MTPRTVDPSGRPYCEACLAQGRRNTALGTGAMGMYGVYGKWYWWPFTRKPSEWQQAHVQLLRLCGPCIEAYKTLEALKQ